MYHDAPHGTIISCSASRTNDLVGPVTGAVYIIPPTSGSVPSREPPSSPKLYRAASADADMRRGSPLCGTACNMGTKKDEAKFLSPSSPRVAGEVTKAVDGKGSTPS